MVFVSDTGPWPYSTYLEAIIGSKETVRRVQQSTGLRPGVDRENAGSSPVCPTQYCHLVLVLLGHGLAEAPRKSLGNMRWLGLRPTLQLKAACDLLTPPPMGDSASLRKG